MKRLDNGQTTQSYLVLYYAKAVKSESSNVERLASFHVIDYKTQPGNQCLDGRTKSGELFHKKHVHYFGQVTENQTSNVIGRRYSRGDTIAFTMSLDASADLPCVALREQYREFFPQDTNAKILLNPSRTQQWSKIVLRRRFYSPTSVWTQQAKLWINGRAYGDWFIPMGTFNDHYSLRQSDVTLHTDDAMHLLSERQIRVVLEPQTHWYDVEYELIGFK